MIPAYPFFFIPVSWYWAVVMGVALNAFNGYLEGKTGQSAGKMLTGLRTIHDAKPD